jgi:hypothetical protein
MRKGRLACEVLTEIRPTEGDRGTGRQIFAAALERAHTPLKVRFRLFDEVVVPVAQVLSRLNSNDSAV